MLRRNPGGCCHRSHLEPQVLPEGAACAGRQQQEALRCSWPDTRPPHAHCPLPGDGEKTEGRWGDLWVRQGRFNRGSKSCACSQSERRNSFTTCHRRADVQPLPGELGLSAPNGCLNVEDKHHNHKHPRPPPLPAFFTKNIAYRIENPFGWLSWPCTLSDSHLPTASLLWGAEWGKETPRRVKEVLAWADCWRSAWAWGSQAKHEPWHVKPVHYMGWSSSLPHTPAAAVPRHAHCSPAANLAAAKPALSGRAACCRFGTPPGCPCGRQATVQNGHF